VHLSFSLTQYIDLTEFSIMRFRTHCLSFKRKTSNAIRGGNDYIRGFSLYILNSLFPQKELYVVNVLHVYI